MRIFHRRQPASPKGIRARSAVVRSAEMAAPVTRPISAEEARAALERSRARRRANGEL